MTLQELLLESEFAVVGGQFLLAQHCVLWSACKNGLSLYKSLYPYT